MMDAGANCAHERSRLSSSSPWCSLLVATRSRIASSRATGPSTSVVIRVNMPVTLLVPSVRVAPISASCTETGIIATSGCPGSSPRSCRNSRIAPEQAASTTSLTLTPKWSLTFFTSASGTAANAMERWPVIELLSEVRGALNGAGIAAPRRERVHQRTGTGRVRGRSETSDSGRSRTFLAPSAASASSGAPPVDLSTIDGSSAGGSGVSEHSWAIRPAPVTPSTPAWCMRIMIAIRPSARPSMTHISHSGLLRSSAWPAMCAHNSASSCSPPGAGTAMRCTCASMSKDSSSTHTG